MFIYGRDTSDLFKTKSAVKKGYVMSACTVLLFTFSTVS